MPLPFFEVEEVLYPACTVDASCPAEEHLFACLGETLRVREELEEVLAFTAGLSERDYRRWLAGDLLGPPDGVQ